MHQWIFWESHHDFESWLGDAYIGRRQEKVFIACLHMHHLLLLVYFGVFFSQELFGYQSDMAVNGLLFKVESGRVFRWWKRSMEFVRVRLRSRLRKNFVPISHIGEGDNWLGGRVSERPSVFALQCSITSSFIPAFGIVWSPQKFHRISHAHGAFLVLFYRRFSGKQPTNGWYWSCFKTK